MKRWAVAHAHRCPSTVCLISILLITAHFWCPFHQQCPIYRQFTVTYFTTSSPPPTTTTPMISLFQPELHYLAVGTLMVERILLRCSISHRVKTPPRRSYLDKSNPMSRSVDKCSNAVLPKECLVTILWLSHWRCHHILEGSQLKS